MQTELLTINDTAWTELLSDGGVVVLSDASGHICFAVGSATPALDAAAHSISPTELHTLASFGDIPAGVKAFVRSAKGEQKVVVSR